MIRNTLGNGASLSAAHAIIPRTTSINSSHTKSDGDEQYAVCGMSPF